MSFIVWLCVGLGVAAIIFWLMDWQSHHEDGE